MDSLVIEVKNNVGKNAYINITYNSTNDEKILQFYAYSSYIDEFTGNKTVSRLYNMTNVNAVLLPASDANFTIWILNSYPLNTSFSIIASSSL